MGAFQNCLPLGLCFYFVVVVVVLFVCDTYYNFLPISYLLVLQYIHKGMTFSAPSPRSRHEEHEKSLEKKSFSIFISLVANDCQRSCGENCLM